VTPTWIAVDDMTCRLQGGHPRPRYHRRRDNSAPLTRVCWSLDLYGDSSSRAAVYRVVPSCSCYRCVDLSCGRDSGTTDYAIELPLFRRSIILRALTWKRRQQPSSRASTLPSGYFPYFNTYNKCTGVCRFVRGIPVGSATVSPTCGVSVGLAEGTYSEIVWLGAGWTTPTRANANRTTGLPNSYRRSPTAVSRSLSGLGSVT
jgi:hypothetical protein